MDPSSPRLVPNPIRIRRVFAKTGEAVFPMVWCQRDADSRRASDCLNCRAFAGLSYDSLGGAQEVNVFCEVEPPMATTEPPTMPPVAHRVPIAQLIDRDLICVRPEVSVRRAMAIMLSHDLDCVPVVDDKGLPLGLFTKTRALALCHESMEQTDRAERRDQLDREVGPNTPPSPLLVSPLTPIADVITKMGRSDVDHVLVVCRDGCLIGVLGSRDLLAWMCPPA